MGEGKRRKQLDPEYGQPVMVSGSDNNDMGGWRPDLGAYWAKHYPGRAMLLPKEKISMAMVDSREGTINFIHDGKLGTVIASKELTRSLLAQTVKSLTIRVSVSERYRAASGETVVPFFVVKHEI
jgi:hypothetical protein